MELMPGIDLLDGKCVCPVHRPFADDEQVSHDPAEVAKVWSDQGARRLYIADLDGARMGIPQNLVAVEKIINATKVPVDLGGGIRTLDTAKKIIDLGVDRVVLGTTAALDDNLAKEIFGNIGDKAVLSVASLNGYVAVRDWQARTDERTIDFAKRMVESNGAKRLVFTDVSRKGMHGGVNIIAVKRMAETLNIPIIASGGVSGLEDLRELKELEPSGVEGVVVVTAIYSGSMNFREALEICDS